MALTRSAVDTAATEEASPTRISGSKLGLLGEWLRQPLLQGIRVASEDTGSLSTHIDLHATRPPAVRVWEKFNCQAKACLEPWLSAPLPESFLCQLDDDLNNQEASSIVTARLLEGIVAATLVLSSYSPGTVFNEGLLVSSNGENGQGTLLCYGGQRKVLIIHGNVLDGNDLSTAAKNIGPSTIKPSCEHLIERVYGHLIWQGVAYGMFVTNETCTFVRIDPSNGSLMISPNIRHDAKDITAKQGLLYVLNLAIKQEPFDMLANIALRKTITPESYNGLMWRFLGLPEMQVIRVEDVSVGDCLCAADAVTVYEAVMYGILVALKVAHVYGTNNMSDVQRLGNEVKISTNVWQLQGFVLPKVHAYGLVQNRAGDYLPFLAIERLDGDTLDKAIHSLPESELPDAMKAVTAAFTRLHVEGYIQASVEPHNVMLRSDGTAVIINFGSAEKIELENDNTWHQSMIVNRRYNMLCDDSPDQLADEKTKVQDMLIDLIMGKLVIGRHEAQAKLMKWTQDTSMKDETPADGEYFAWIRPEEQLAHEPFEIIRHGDVRLGRLLGTGNAGKVYEAHMYGTRVAIKIPHVCGGSSMSCVDRLIKEIQVFNGLKPLQGNVIPRALTHGIVSTLPDGSRMREDLPYLAMERINGSTLDYAIASMPEEQVPCVIKAVIKAYKQLHVAGYTQGSVKPPNVMLCNSGRVVIIDFGRGEKIGDERFKRHFRLMYALLKINQPHIDEKANVQDMLVGLLSEKLGISHDDARKKLMQWQEDMDKEDRAAKTQALT